jgi:hypothetical protein
LAFAAAQPRADPRQTIRLKMPSDQAFAVNIAHNFWLYCQHLVQFARAVY